MATWYIGIDETGKFNPLDPEDCSNASAVVTKRNNRELLKIFQEVGLELRLSAPVKVESGRQVKLTDKQKILEKFHGCKLGDKFRVLDALLSKDKDLMEFTIQSEGRPIVTVNPQQWWTASVLGVLHKFFLCADCKKGDEVLVEIASRGGIVLGLIDENLSKDMWEVYNKVLAQDIENELRRNYKRFKISVKLKSAGSSELPTLADLVSNMHKGDYQEHAAQKFDEGILKKIRAEKTAPLSASFGKDVAMLMERGEFLNATEALLTEIFDGKSDNVDFLGSILKRSREYERVQIWETILASCESAVVNRGDQGNAVNYVDLVFSRLAVHFNEIPGDDLKMRCMRLNADYMGHAGKWNPRLFDKIERSFKMSDFGSPLEGWDFYVHVFSAKAQNFFNVYKFGELDYSQLLRVQKSINEIDFPFKDGGLHPDKNYSEIIGTIGQDYAFCGRYDEAIKYFEEDFDYSPVVSKSICASFLTDVYVRLRDLKNARKWLKEQERYTLLTTRNKNDQWLVLNRLRVDALAIEMGEPVSNPRISDWHNEGDYPWPLLLKWCAYVEYRNGDSKKAGEHLAIACKNLVKSAGFTVRTLALSVMAMQIYMCQDGECRDPSNLEQFRKEYGLLLKRSMDESPSFKKYVANHPEIKHVQHKAESFWEAAHVLPFNYS